MNALGGDMAQNGANNLGDGNFNNVNDIDAQIGDEGFDANVEADPETDPKKYIQQLTGKLSQELRKYNDQQEQPDEDLNKYVAGMIIPQASKSLTDKGKKDIIGKLKKTTIDDSVEEIEPETEIDDEQPNMSNENRNKRFDLLKEIFSDIINQNDIKNRKEDKVTNKKITKTNPFVVNF